MIRYVELRRLLPTANILHAPYPTQAFFKHTTHTYLNKKKRAAEVLHDSALHKSITDTDILSRFTLSACMHKPSNIR